MNKEKMTPYKVESISANLKLGTGDYDLVPEGCKHLIVKAAVSDSGELMMKVDSPVVFYVTLLAYLDERKGLHRLFDEPSDRHLAINFVYSSVQADELTHKKSGKGVPSNVVRAKEAIGVIVRNLEKGNEVGLDLFHDAATGRYQIISDELTVNNTDNFDSIPSILDDMGAEA